MKKFYTFEPKNFRIFTKMKSFLAVALLLLMAVGTANAQTAQLVTSVSDLSIGDEIIIVGLDEDYALSTNQKSSNRGAAAITRSNNVITYGEGVQVIALKAGKISGTFALNVGTGFLYASSSSNNQLKTESSLDGTEESSNGSWTINITSEGVATIDAQGANTHRRLRYNPNNGSPLFNCYLTEGSGSATGTLVSIYKVNTPCTEPVTRSESAKLCGLKNGTNYDQFYKVGSTTYTSWDHTSGIYTDTIPGVGGACDTVVTLDLTVIPFDYYIEHEMAEGDTWDFYGTPVTDSGWVSVPKTFTASETACGCDSIIYAHVTYTPTILPDTMYEEVATICEGQSYTFAMFDGNDTICTETNIYMFTKAGAAQGGRDSVRVLYLDVVSETEVDVDTIICEGDLPFVFYGYTYDESTEFGTHNYNLHVENVGSCDTYVHLHLTLGHVYDQEEELVICSSQLPYDWRDTTFEAGTESGTIVFNKKTDLGCDSIVTLHLTVNPAYTALEVDSTICKTELPITWNGITVADTTSAGEYTFTYNGQTVLGCDSIVKLNLTINPIYYVEVDTTICASELPFHITGSNAQDTVFNEAGNYVIPFVSALGCDSTITLKLAVNPVYNDTVDITICASLLETGYQWRDTTFAAGTTSGYYTFNKVTAAGCDSIQTLNLTVNPVYNHTDAKTICSSELPYTYDTATNKVYPVGTESMIDTIHFATVEGCDSTVILTLTVNPSYKEEAAITICANELPYTFDAGNGNTKTYPVGTESKLDTIEFPTALGCDSVVILDLTVTPISACQFTVHVEAGENGTILGDTVVAHGDTARFTVKAADCYYIESITKDNADYTFDPESTEVEVSFDSVYANGHTLAATFAMFQYKVTAIAHGEGTLTPTATFNCDSAVVYNYAAATGYHIDSLKIDDDVTVYTDENTTEGTKDFGNIRANHTIDVYYSINHYTVTISAGEHGNVTPLGDTVVTYGARPVLYFTSDNCMEVASITVNGNQIDTTCTTFQLDSIKENTTVAIAYDSTYYPVVVTRGGNGSGTVNGNYEVEAGSYLCNERVTFDVIADAGSHLDTIIWNNETHAYTGHVMDEVLGVTHITQPMNLYVVFTLDKMHLTATTDGNGWITPNDTMIDYGTPATVIVEADSNNGYHIATITSGEQVWENTANEGTVHEFTLDNVITDTTISATFALNRYTVAVEKVGEGTVTPDIDTVIHGGNIVYTIAAGDCHRIDSIYMDGLEQTVTAPDTVEFTVSNVVTSDRVLRVVFGKIPYAMTATFNSAEGTVSDSIVECGSNYTYTITPNTGYHVDTIYFDAENFVTGATSYTFTDIREDHNIKVVFAINQYEVTASTDGNGTVTPTSETVAHGSDLTFTVVPNDCYHVSSITVGDSVYDLSVLANGTKIVTTTVAEANFDNIVVTTPSTGDNYNGTECEFESSNMGTPGNSGLTGWAQSSMYKSTGKLKGGSGSNVGYITTPALDLSGDYYTVSFDAKGWMVNNTAELTTLDIQVGSTVEHTEILEGNQNCELNHYSFTGTTTETSAKVKFGSKNVSGGDKRFYIDNILITVSNTVPTDSVQTFTVYNITEATTVTVNFALDTFQLAQTITGGGTVNDMADTIVNVLCSTDYIFNIAAAEGNHIVSYTVDGGTPVTVDNSESYVATLTDTIKDIHADCTLAAEFAVNTYTIYTETVTGQGNFDPAQVTVNYGADTTIVVTADNANGYHIASVTANGVTTTYTNDDHKLVDTVVYSHVTANDTLKVEFALDLHLITVINNGHGNIHPTDTNITYGEDVTFAIEADDCYFISGIMVDSVQQTISNLDTMEYTFTSVVEPHTIEVTFAPYRYVMSSRVYYPSMGEVTPSADTIDCGVDYTYVIRANEGYHIEDVYLDGVLDTLFTNQEDEYDLTVENVRENHKVIVNFAMDYYTLHLAVAEEGTGTIVCDSTDLTHIAYNTPLQFTMTPADCYELTGLTINDTNYFDQVVNGILTWNAIDSGEVLATFSMIRYEVAASFDETMGEVTPSIDTVNCGDTVTFVMDAKEGYHIESYTIGDSTASYLGNDVVTDTLVVNAVSSDTTVTVTFGINTYNVNVCTPAPMGGTLTPEYTVVNHGDTCKVAIVADSIHGYHIDTITCGATVVPLGANENTCYTFSINNITSDTTICASFSLNNYTISASVTDAENITIVPANDSLVKFGDTVRYVVSTLNDCHYISTIVIDDTTTITYNDSVAYTYTFENIQANHTIVANADVYTYIANTSVNYDSLGTITPTDTLDCGENFVYNVTPITGYHIDSVTVDGVAQTIADSSTFSGTIEDIHANTAIVAYFGINHYTITSDTVENGTITPGETTIVYEYGMTPEYTITPAACYYISDVMVDGTEVELTTGDSTGGTYKFDSLEASHTIVAHFEIYMYAMTADFDATMGNVNTADTTCGSDYQYMITANEGYHIVSYTIGSLTVTNTLAEPNDFTVDSVMISPVSQDTNLVVVFDTNTYTVSACIGVTGGTLVVNEPTEVNHNEGTTVTVTADWANGYHIVAITDGRGDTATYGNNTDTLVTYNVNNVTEDIEVCATFALNTFHITATAGENGTIEPNDTTVTYGDMIDFIIEPNHTCYYISDITLDGTSVWADYTDSVSAYTYTVNVSEFDPAVVEHTIATEYTIFRYEMASTVNDDAMGTVTSATVDCGTDYDYEISATYGYHIDHVVLDGVTNNYEGQQDSATITVTDIHENHQLDVYFEINHYMVTATAGEHGTIEVAGVTTVAHGESLTYTITPDHCYYIEEVLVNDEAVEFTTGDSTGATYTFASIEDTMTIHANFHIYEYAMTADYDATMGYVEEGIANCGSNFTYNVTANEGYHIVSITVGSMVHNHYGLNEDTAATFNVYGVSSDTVCYVVFEANTYNVTFNVTGEGEVEPGNTTVTYDSTLAYTATAAEGYHIVSVTDNGTEVYSNTDRDVTTYDGTIANIRENHVVDVVFAINQYTITATAGAEGQIVMPGENIVNYGENVNFTIRATEDCYFIDRILVDGEVDTTFTNNETLYTYTFNAVDTDHTIEAQFATRTYTVIVTSTEGGTVDPSEDTTTLNCGDNATYTFTPDEGYEVVSVTVNGQNMGAQTTYTISGIQNDYTIDVVFGQITYTLTSTAYNHGTIDPLGDTTVAAGSTVVYTLTPEDCYTVSEVLVNGVSYLNNEAFDGTTLTLDDIQADMNIQAYFQIKKYTVETEAAEGGVITETAVYNCGTDVVITITPEACYDIEAVEVDGQDQGAVTEVTFNALDTNHTVNVTFTMKTYVITASVNDDAAGTITETDTFNCGETPTYVITANEGYHITGVEVDGEDQGVIESYTFGSLSEDHTITANFAINTYTLTVNANTGVEIAPVAGDTTVEYGASVTYTFTVDSCYEISDVTLDGESLGAITTYTFDAVDDNHVMMVNATVKTYTITATTNEGGSITPAGETSVTCNGTQSYSITAAAGYYVEDVLVDGASVGVVNNYVFSGVTEDHTIEVVFASNDSLTYTISATAGANGTITPEGDTTVYQGTSITYVFTPNEYYTVDQVIVDGNVLPTPVTTYTFSNIMADHTIEVTFVADQIGCVTPGILYTTNITENSATFNWNDTEAASYTVRYKKLSDTTYTIVSGITGTTYDVTGLDEATEYVWSVKAVCVDSVAESAWSVSVTFVTEETIDTTSINNAELSTINVYSYGNDIYVTNESNEQIKDIRVYDINGRLIHRGVAQSNPEVINVTASNGIYIVRVVTNTMVRNFKVSITQR